jgi:hypothetical protein
MNDSGNPTYMFPYFRAGFCASRTESRQSKFEVYEEKKTGCIVLLFIMHDDVSATARYIDV